MKKLIQGRRGSALIVEAAFVFPIVFLCVGFVIWLGMIMLTRAQVHAYAQRIAIYAARCVSFPGYEDLVTLENTTDIDASEIHTGAISEVMKIHDPYRYWAAPMTKRELGVVTETLSSMVKTGVIMGIGEPTVDVKAKNHVLSQQVTVTVDYGGDTPGFVAYLAGIAGYTTHVEAYAASSDPAEFIRNIDIVWDFGKFLNEKLGISERIGGMLDRIKEYIVK